METLAARSSTVPLRTPASKWRPSTALERDSALVELAALLEARGYRFTCISPASHTLVNARAGNELARDLAGVFGWNRPFDPEVLPREVLETGLRAGALEITQWRLRSTVRFSTLRDALVVHSAFPTSALHSVFFGPDTYRFVNLLERSLAGGRSLVELGCGTGVAALSVCDRYSHTVLIDTNPLALRYAAVNARINARLVGPRRLEFLQGDLFAGAAGPFDAIVANAPFTIDAERRPYRNGGARGFDLSLRILRESLPRLSAHGRLVIYTGIPFTDGQSPFHGAVAEILGERRFVCEELEVDVLGDDLAGESHGRIDRLGVVALIVDGDHSDAACRAGRQAVARTRL
jgi:SAM-dependent methyltransferase